MNTVVELQRVVQERTDIEKKSNLNPGTLADHDQTSCWSDDKNYLMLCVVNCDFVTCV